MSAMTAEAPASEASAEKTSRNYVHIPFDTMKCPVEPDKVSGSIPGIKRRVKKLWPEKYASIEWPPLRTVDGLILAMEDMDDEHVDAIAKHVGVEDPEADLETIAKACLKFTGAT